MVGGRGLVGDPVERGPQQLVAVSIAPIDRRPRDRRAGGDRLHGDLLRSPFAYQGQRRLDDLVVGALPAGASAVTRLLRCHGNIMTPIYTTVYVA
jgi:hypothetical protein